MIIRKISASWLLAAFILLSASCSAGTSAKNADSDSITPATPDTISLFFVGDAMQHGPQLRAALAAGGGKHHDYTGYFTLLEPDIKAADYAVANLEVPLGGGPEYRGYPRFSAPDVYARALVDAGFDMLLTANNHCLDSGDKAARRTLSTLDSLHVDHIGTYTNAADRQAKVPFIKDIKGAKIAFLNYTYGTNGIKPTAGMEVAYINQKRMAEEIALAKKAGAEFIIVTLHWGVEYQLVENESQRSLANFLIDSGADMIIGAHPHVVQPMKVVHSDKLNKDVLVVYSLGNFISNMNDTPTRGGALVRTRLVNHPDSGVRFLDANHDLFFTAKPEGANKNFKVVPSWHADQIPAGQRSTWQNFNKVSSDVLNKHNVAVPRLHQ